MKYATAEQAWTALHSLRSGLLQRCERYAALTVVKVMLPDGVDLMSMEQSTDYQSIGARCVNHLTNKFMSTMFSPSRPFFRAGAGKKTKADLAKVDMTETDLVQGLGKIEREAVALLDRRGQRPKLYQILRNLIITGNGLLCEEGEELRAMGLKYYVVKRNSVGKVITLVIKEDVLFDELEQRAQAELSGLYSDDSKVSHYRWIKWVDGKYEMTQWVNTHKLSNTFDGRWSEEDLPYHALAWDLTDEADYGTGLVEEYIGALEATSCLAEGVVDGAVAGTEMRWMVNPTGMTSAEDFNKSRNGDALPGRKEDVDSVTVGNAQSITVADSVLSRYEQQLSQAFLLFTGTVRQAERVTAEEIRLQASELESAYGGVYSMLGRQLQGPVARWLIRGIDPALLKSDLEYTVITGLDALSRGSDLESLRLALGDLAQIAQLPEELQGRLDYEKVTDYVGNGRNIDLRALMKSPEAYQQWQEQQAEMRVAEQAAVNQSKVLPEQGM